MNRSVWNQPGLLPEFPPLEGDTSTDVLIIGSGLAGLLTARMLTDAGLECLLIEQGPLFSGVSPNSTAKVTSQHGLIYEKLLDRFGPRQARLYYDANQTALEQYRQLAREIPCDFEARDSYVFSSGDPALIRREQAALKQLDIPWEPVPALPLPFPTGEALCFRDQAQLHPVKLAAGLSRGLNIRLRTGAQGFRGNTVLTNRGQIRANRIIIATHFPMLNKHGAYFLKLYQHRSYVIGLENAPRVEGMYLDASGDRLSLRSHGNVLLLGGGGHRTGKPGQAWDLLEQRAREFWPEAKVLSRWAAQDCMSLDGMPYIGSYGRNTRDLYVATGFNKWGLTGSMVSALLLRDLLLGRENPWARLFRPQRSMLRPQLARNALEATLSLLRPTKPRCPHMGCALRWNPQEHSWDCPCHGSRFSPDGQCLDGPATGPLP